MTHPDCPDRSIRNGLVLTDQGLCSMSLQLSGGQIGTGVADDALIDDAQGLWVLPGIIDLHGDAFERVISPRPNVHFPTELALPQADREMITNGITTAFHGLTLSWEPGLRSAEQATRMVASYQALAPRLMCDTRFNFRWETFATDELDLLIGWLASLPSSIASINDHTSVNFAEPPGSRKLRRMIERMGLPEADAMAALSAAHRRSPEVPDAIRRLCAFARENGVALLAHDEVSPNARAEARSLGVHTSEFPMNMETARAAIDGGESVVLGAPNVLRGGSQNDAVNASEAIAAGCCTALASDYWYPAQLHAAFRLVRDGMPLSKAWALISEGPARAAGLNDRGWLRPGLRADVILVDPKHEEVVAVYVAGRRVLYRG